MNLVFIEIDFCLCFSSLIYFLVSVIFELCAAHVALCIQRVYLELETLVSKIAQYGDIQILVIISLLFIC